MSDVPFFKTIMGHRFFEHTMPELVRQLTQLNALLERVVREREGNGSEPKKAIDGQEAP